MATATERTNDEARAEMVKMQISVHRSLHRKIKAVTDYHDISFQEWAFPILVEAALKDLDRAVAALRD